MHAARSTGQRPRGLCRVSSIDAAGRNTIVQHFRPSLKYHLLCRAVRVLRKRSGKESAGIFWKFLESCGESWRVTESSLVPLPPIAPLSLHHNLPGALSCLFFVELLLPPGLLRRRHLGQFLVLLGARHVHGAQQVHHRVRTTVGVAPGVAHLV